MKPALHDAATCSDTYYDWQYRRARCCIDCDEICNICEPNNSRRWNCCTCSVTPAQVALENDENDKIDAAWAWFREDGAGEAPAVLQLHSDAEGWVKPPSKDETDIGRRSVNATISRSSGGAYTIRVHGTPGLNRVQNPDILNRVQNGKPIACSGYRIGYHKVALNGAGLSPGARSLLHTARSLDGVRHAAPRLWQRRGAVATPSNWLVRCGSKTLSVRARR